jgi:hypothetical protein
MFSGTVLAVAEAETGASALRLYNFIIQRYSKRVINYILGWYLCTVIGIERPQGTDMSYLNS